MLLITMMAFIPMFFFASEYAQIALHKKASEAGIFLLFFFIGFVVAAQIGGRILDREGAKRAVVLGCAIAAVGFGFWASKATTLSFSKQQIWVIVAGAGMGMMLGPANTDAVNRAVQPLLRRSDRHHPDHPELRRQPGPGRAGHDPAVRLPLAPHGEPAAEGVSRTQRRWPTVSPSPAGGGSVSTIPHYVSVDFAHATQTVLYVMCGIMAFAGLVALLGLQRGRQEVVPETRLRCRRIDDPGSTRTDTGVS